MGMEIKIEDIGHMTKFLYSILYNSKKKDIKKIYNPKVSFIIYNVYIKDI